jgi:hypothetical protein
MKRLTMAIVCAALLAFTAGMSAHENYRVIGKVEKVSKDTVDVKQTKDGKIITMDWTEKSKVTRDKKDVPRAEIKAGANVVVDAHGDSLDELEVVELRLVPAASAKPAK